MAQAACVKKKKKKKHGISIGNCDKLPEAFVDAIRVGVSLYSRKSVVCELAHNVLRESAPHSRGNTDCSFVS